MDEPEQKRRERAYKIWEDEGRVHGLHEDHWKRAREQPELGGDGSQSRGKQRSETRS